MSDRRFTINFEFTAPGEPTGVALYDRQASPPRVGTGTGGSRAGALLDLWRNLRDSGASDAAIATVEEWYQSFTGKMPFREADRPHAQHARPAELSEVRPPDAIPER